MIRCLGQTVRSRKVQTTLMRQSDVLVKLKKQTHKRTACLHRSPKQLYLAAASNKTGSIHESTDDRRRSHLSATSSISEEEEATKHTPIKSPLRWCQRKKAVSAAYI
jgi:hypothetical protein